MSLEVRLAETDAECRAAFALRHRVFIGERIVGTPSPDGLLVDVFDALPSTRLFVALDDAHVVGTLRLSLPGPHRHPCDAWFEWRRRLPEATTASGSMLCTDPAARNAGIGLLLIDALMRCALAHGTTHGVAPIRPEAEPVLERLGYQRMGEPFHHPTENVPVVPMTVDLEDWHRIGATARTRASVA